MANPFKNVKGKASPPIKKGSGGPGPKPKGTTGFGKPHGGQGKKPIKGTTGTIKRK